MPGSPEQSPSPEQHGSPERSRRFGSRVPLWLRALIPAVLIVVWLGAAAIGGPYFGKVDEVSSNDQTSFLPASADATRVQELQAGFSESDAIPAIVLAVRAGGLDDGDRAFLQSAASGLATTEGVAGDVSPVIESDDGEAAQVFVPLDASGEVDAIVGDIREQLGDGAPAGLEVYVTGPAGFTADLVGAFAGIDGILLLVALAAVFVILIVVYRSPLLPVLVLVTSLFALCASILTVWWLAKAGIVLLNGQVQGILFILVIGAATDYSLLYVSRYREALRDNLRRWSASWDALRRSAEPILASGGTVIVGLLCLLFSDLNSNKALGPVAAVGIVFSLLAALTLLPALLLACGRVSFWPLLPRYGSAHPVLVGDTARGLWPRLGRGIARRPRTIWVVCTLALVALSFGVTQLRADGVAQSELVLAASEARDGQAALGEHFPGGSGSPALVVAPDDELQDVADAALANDGVSSVAVVSADSPSGSAPVTGDGLQAQGPPGTPAGQPTVVDGRVLLQVTLADAPDSAAAESVVTQLRDSFAALPEGDQILVGGATATAVDSNAAAIHDRNTIIPIVLVVILLILMLLLRAVLAPVLLVLSVVLSFGAALGVSALVFDTVFDFPGADPSVPLFGFVFLVALGIDYNIFLMTRVREESLRYGTRPGILRGLAATGGVITSAGLVLAATFAALGVIPILFLAQIAFIVAFGVLLDTLVVRSLLVPALAYDLGRRVWWPSRLARTDGGHAGAHASPAPVDDEHHGAHAASGRLTDPGPAGAHASSPSEH
ncbi:MMPL family transporter [Compostimonas suwonensis]|uniref:RND superfamily putative drug exporter n=1 Tax=Compostimonas suwonensis TaxID=1048394 RepID=A0A2M9BBW8_9MICO|nr:MMPL family transporter [Compostimonas suwonensis]PJJ55422.1 RND superfamily putative drug exporter [Compostimonas suwonensis]